jgi:hypothetical protein
VYITHDVVGVEMAGAFEKRICDRGWHGPLVWVSARTPAPDDDAWVIQPPTVTIWTPARRPRWPGVCARPPARAAGHPPLAHGGVEVTFGRLRHRRQAVGYAFTLELGDPISVGLTRVQARVLAALARSPRGLASIRSVARRAGVSPTAAGRALDSLTLAGLVRAEKQTLALGRATPVLVYSAVGDHPRWHGLAPALAEVALPPLPEQVPAQTVPYYLRHLFWNTRHRNWT